MDKLPNDVVYNMLLYLPFRSGCNVNKVMKLNLKEKDIFHICHKNNKIFQETISYYDMSHVIFDDIKKSIFQIDQISNIIHDIGFNKINRSYKNLIFETKNIKTDIEHTLKIYKVLLKMIEKYVIGEFIINNPYITFFTNVSANMINYFINIIISNNELSISYNEINRKIIKFRLMIYQSPWYNTNINVFNLFILYINRLKILTQDTNQIKILNSTEITDNTLKCLFEFNKLLKSKKINELMNT